MLRYPLNFRLAIAGFGAIGIGGPLVTVEDASGQTVALAEREDPSPGGEDIAETVAVYADGGEDGERERQLCRIRAERLTDDLGGVVWEIAGAEGGALGTLTRQGARSLWRASYEVEDTAGDTVARAAERHPWVKVVESFPLVGTLGVLLEFVLNPAYELETAAGKRTQLRKEPSLLERSFVLDEPEGGFTAREEALLLPTAITIVLFERRRG